MREENHSTVSAASSPLSGAAPCPTAGRALIKRTLRALYSNARPASPSRSSAGLSSTVAGAPVSIPSMAAKLRSGFCRARERRDRVSQDLSALVLAGTRPAVFPLLPGHNSSETSHLSEAPARKNRVRSRTAVRGALLEAFPLERHRVGADTRDLPSGTAHGV